MNPYLSIIVPVYNVQNYLKKCIESILIQSFQDFELILVNDGSTDDSGKICDEYLLQDRRVKVIHKLNGGLGDARNAGIIDSIGEFIGFVDSDDWIDSDMYQVLINLQIQHKSDIVSCNYMRTDTSKNDDSLKIVNYSRDEALNDLYSNKFIKWIVCNKIYKSSLFNDLLFEKVVILEDVLITPQLLYNTKKITHIDKSLYI